MDYTHPSEFGGYTPLLSLLTYAPHLLVEPSEGLCDF
jgi:hypothetical protein